MSGEKKLAAELRELNDVLSKAEPLQLKSLLKDGNMVTAIFAEMHPVQARRSAKFPRNLL
jgi:hypothetical protein